jgi:acyl dehydratase
VQAAQLRHHQEQGQYPGTTRALQVLPLVSPAHQASRDSLAIDQFKGREYGPFSLRVCREKVDEFVAATGDDPDRWTEHAPPGWAAVALFAAAPHLLGDPVLGELTRSVIHGEQRFSWAGPIAIETELSVRGRITRIRERGGVWLVGFYLEAGPLRGTSSFLMSGTAPPGGQSGEVAELGPHEKEPGEFSASRSDLIRYAAATRDWNPIHWDHQSAVQAGLGGIVVHGLLQAAWMLRHVVSGGARQVVEARFRFRSPLLAGEKAEIVAQNGDGQMTVLLTRGDRELVAASLALS